MSTFTGYHYWAIYTKDEVPELRACFATRRICVDWLKHKKEEAFFETGSMETAKKLWGEHNFRFEEVFVMTRKSFVNNFDPVNFSEKWNYDI